MNGALKKELIWIRKSWILYLIFIIVMGAVGCAATPAVLMLPLFSSLIQYTSLAYDETSGWERLNAATPNERTAFVNAKFITFLISTAASMLIAAICCIIAQFMEDVQLIEEAIVVWAAVPLCIPAGMFLPIIFFPIWAKFGYKTTSLILPVLSIGLALFLPVIGEWATELENKETFTAENVVKAADHIVPFAVLITVILTAVSWILTVKIYKKKDL